MNCDGDEYEKVKGFYRINSQLMAKSKSDMILLHPLPRVDEIDVAIDQLPQAKYFAQAEYGVFVRMALLAMMSKNK